MSKINKNVLLILMMPSYISCNVTLKKLYPLLGHRICDFLWVTTLHHLWHQHYTFQAVVSSCHQMVPHAIWENFLRFPQFAIINNRKIWKARKMFAILHEAICNNYFIVKCLLKLNIARVFFSRCYIKGFVWYNLCDSQSVFKFSLRLHYHTSCSYWLHKSCSDRVFSLQEFKQNDSRTSCNSNNYFSNFPEKQVKEKEKKREEFVLNIGLKEEKSENFMKLCLQNAIRREIWL